MSPQLLQQDGRKHRHVEVLCASTLHAEIIRGEGGLVMSEWRSFEKEVVESVRIR